jgi:hypothetical protein
MSNVEPENLKGGSVPAGEHPDESEVPAQDDYKGGTAPAGEHPDEAEVPTQEHPQ